MRDNLRQSFITIRNQIQESGAIWVPSYVKPDGTTMFSRSYDKRLVKARLKELDSVIASL